MAKFKMQLAYGPCDAESDVTDEEASKAADAALEALALNGATSEVSSEQNLLTIVATADGKDVFKHVIDALKDQGLTILDGRLFEGSSKQPVGAFQNGTYAPA